MAGFMAHPRFSALCKLGIALLLAGCFGSESAQIEKAFSIYAEDELSVHCLNIGQGVGISEGSLIFYQRWANAGAIALHGLRRRSPIELGMALGGSPFVASVSLGPKAQEFRSGRVSRQSQGKICIDIGSFSGFNLEKKENIASRAGVIIAGEVYYKFEPNKKYSEFLKIPGQPSASDPYFSKYRARIVARKVESQDRWEIIAVDTAGGNQDFVTSNVPSALAGLR